jgi:amino acid adenylation domain-containing protein|tara:strand:+ start:564 stop:2027 length:1464 start_codon:yes stop_codon:yes gene_type:complete
LHETIDAQFRLRADKIAIVDSGNGATLTYGQLQERSVAQELRMRQIGLAKGERVAILAAKSPDVIAAFVGASRLGVIYVPLDVTASPKYWNMVLADLAIEHVLSDVTDLCEHLGDVQIHALVPEIPRQLLGHNASVEPCSRSSDDGAYILTTSGSTGRPKGVLLSHRNALAFTEWASNEIALGADDAVLSVAPFHFDLSVFDIYASLSRGATLVLAPPTATMFPGLLIDVLTDHKISILYTVPTLLQSLMDAGVFSQGQSFALRNIIYAGEPFPVPRLAALMTALPDVAFYNFFGPTETNVSLAHRFTAVPDPDSEVPIGRPASGATITLLDDDRREVAPGEIGEIVVTGPTVMKGYLKADGFEPACQPFDTGDFAVQGGDGAYYFRGRKDHQVKVRGNRIELASVENALLRSGATTEVALVIVENSLVAFVVSDTQLEEQALRAYCMDQLPPAAVPHKFVPISVLPRLSNQKLDVLRLKELASDHR